MNGRDSEIVRFISLHGMARTDQIKRLFFDNLRVPKTKLSNRMKAIVKATEVKERYGVYTRQKVYYIGSDKQEEHKLLLSEFYVLLSTGPGKILEYESEYSWCNIRADAFAAYLIGNTVYPLLIECQLSGYPDFEKYEKLYISDHHWPVFPTVAIISPRRFKPQENSKINFQWIPVTFEGWQEIFSKINGKT